MSWGQGAWGQTPWGSGQAPDPPSIVNPETTLPRLVAADNVADGILLIRFSRSMLQDDGFRDLGNYTINPLNESPPLTFTQITTNGTQLNLATASFLGGPGTYELIVNGVFDLNGQLIDQAANRVEFTVTRAGIEEGPAVHLFDTVFGPMGLTQQRVTRRTVERAVVNRAIDVALKEQLDQRLESLGASIPLRSGKDGGRRA